MNYKETEAYIFNKLPMFHRVGQAAYKKDLSNTLHLLEALNQPHKNLKLIHIGGTNGKGSTSHIFANILYKSGYKVGLYTSPHYKDYRERIKINGKYISKKYITDFIEKNKTIIEQIKPSFFEINTVLALNYFKDEAVDLAIIEVGLGGLYDSTNVITPIMSVITNISYDHQSILG
ncbi:MAG: bifunctional folylpolyglutamate synthase/dihydrofolate synthase, partial [Saprospiraceae bacterium]|nr:bifunctional folylpolyglutamate synthase/dihydrofolate synthase [Saprospiraceae bacterium]